MFTTAPLFGKFHTSLKKGLRSVRRQRPLHHLEHICQSFIAPSLLEPNPGERERIYTPRLTFMAFLDQVIHPGTSCRRAVRQIQSFYQYLSRHPRIDSNTCSYCLARARWSESDLIAIRRHLASHPGINSDVLISKPAVGRPLKVMDGTFVNAPDTAKNRELYPPLQSQEPGCGFPIMRLVGIFDLKNGMLLEEAHSCYAVSENALAVALWPTLCPGDILVADRNFCSFASIASLLALGVDTLFHLHASRAVDFRCGLRLGNLDRLISWPKPKDKSANLTQEQWDALPDRITVRLVRYSVADAQCRCQTITLVTTLLDAKAWPAPVLAALYARRWKIELYFDDIKTTLQMDMLSCLSAEMVHRELQVHLIAYNLIRAIMAESSLTRHVCLDRISFKGTLDTVDSYAIQMAKLPTAHRKRRETLFANMLSVIAQDKVPERPDRWEPRCQKRRPKPYPFMTKPRHLMKDPPKRCRARKK